MDASALERLMNSVQVRSPLDLLLKMRDRRLNHQLNPRDEETLFSILMKKAAAPMRRGDVLLEDALSDCCLLQFPSPELNRALNGGLYSGEVLELCGAAASGKSLLCRAMAARVAREHGAGVLYLNTKCDFDPKAFASLANQPCLSRIRVLYVNNIYSLFSILSNFEGLKGAFNDVRIRLVVIDAVTQLFTPLFGCDSPVELFGLLNSLAVQMRSVAVHNQVAMLLCNQNASNDVGHIRPALGSYWLTVPHIRLSLQMDSNDQTLSFKISKANRVSVGSSGNVNIKELAIS